MVVEVSMSRDDAKLAFLLMGFEMMLQAQMPINEKTYRTSSIYIIIHGFRELVQMLSLSS